MPRPLRIEYPGACYHVMSRGNARLPIFRSDVDKDLFVDRMVHFAALFRVEIRAYCVMINHTISICERPRRILVRICVHS